MWLKTLGLACAVTALSCGGAPPPAPKPAPPPSVAAPAPAAPREASAGLRRYWIFDGKDGVTLYGDLASLLHTELFAGLVPGILSQSEDFLNATQRDCIMVLAAQAHELTVGVDGRGGLLALELGAEGVKDARKACVGALFPVARVAVAGADEAYASGTNVVAVQSGVVLFGSRALVEAALASKVPLPFPASLGLKDDQQLAFNVQAREVSGKGALRVNPDTFRLEAESELPNGAMADMVEQKVKEGREQAKLLEQSQPGVQVVKLANAFDVQRRGNHVTAAFELREPVIDQARDLGVLIGLSVYGVRRYIQEAKTAEARAVTAQIAKSYGLTLQEPLAAGKRATPKKLVSFPAVPAAVPRGVKYQTTPDDWKAWGPIHFALTEPQYYQYEVVAAKDGKTAEIIARGDLDGDGKTSLFRVKIQLEPKTAQLTAVDHTEEEPLE